MSDLGFRLDRRAIPQLTWAAAPQGVRFARERTGFRLLVERAIYANWTATQPPTWAGTKTGCVVDGTTLQAGSPGFWDADPTVFWGADGVAFWDLATAWSYEFSTTPPAVTVGSVMRLSYVAFGSLALTVEYKVGAGAWTPYTDGITVAPATSYSFRVTGADIAAINGLESLSAYVAVPARIERVNGFAVPAGSTRLPLTSAYNDINQVTFQVLPYSTAVTAVALDLDPTLGPDVECRDAGGNPVFGVVNATIIGY